MSQQLKNPSSDIEKLINEGFEVEVRGAYLLIHHIPYVDAARTVQFGTLISSLDFNGDKVARPGTHIVHFVGTHPCHRDGSIMSQIQHANTTQTLAEGIVVNFSFSHKPATGYPNYYEKMTRYIEVISDPALSIDPKAKAQTYRVIESIPSESMFHYIDTNSSRADIEAISAKVKGLSIGIVGLGGTGSYVLDCVAKTPVDEIHIFDGDEFAQHNAFRAPGAPSIEQLREPPPKVDYLASIYSKMHRGIYPHAEFLTSLNLSMLSKIDFVFLCVDNGASKRSIVGYLEASGKPFIDVGMGIHIGENNLVGILRVTTSIPEKRDHLSKLISFTEEKNDAYSTNIQIAELNMLNAAMAVIKWKKLYGFYQDLQREHDSTYSINVNQMLSEEALP